VATADHGMNDKYTPDGKPDVLYLQDLFDEWVGQGKARVILPITDPYVAHHGSLGSFATIYLPAGIDAEPLIARLKTTAGIDVALTRKAACDRFELPADRVGDIVAISSRHKVLGTSRDRHDLSGLTEPLRSHGGLTEERVPMIANGKIVLPAGHLLRNFDVFDVALNRIQ
jgi:phosphonoacetate hydrolase